MKNEATALPHANEAHAGAPNQTASGIENIQEYSNPKKGGLP